MQIGPFQNNIQIHTFMCMLHHFNVFYLSKCTQLLTTTDYTAVQDNNATKLRWHSLITTWDICVLTLAQFRTTWNINTMRMWDVMASCGMFTSSNEGTEAEPHVWKQKDQKYHVEIFFSFCFGSNLWQQSFSL